MSTRVVVMSGRPGRVVGDFPVPFKYPRPPRLRFAEDFARLAGEVSAPQTLSIRTGDKVTLAPCLEKLVPIVQRAQVDYLKSPDKINAFIIDIVRQ